MTVNEPKLGVLGGMGPQATQVFYQYVLDNTQAATDQEHLPTLLLSDTKMPDRTAAILSGDTQGVYHRLRADAKLLAGCGCTAIAIPCNTSHYFVPQLQGEVDIPIVHMIEETAREVAGRGVKKAAILATDGTIQSGLYQNACNTQGVEGVAPPAAIQSLVMSVIYDDIKAGKPGDITKFTHIQQWVKESGCHCAILACTELSVFRTQHPLPSLYVDAMEVLARVSIATCGYPLRGQAGG